MYRCMPFKILVSNSAWTYTCIFYAGNQNWWEFDWTSLCTAKCYILVAVFIYVQRMSRIFLVQCRFAWACSRTEYKLAVQRWKTSICTTYLDDRVLHKILEILLLQVVFLLADKIFSQLQIVNHFIRTYVHTAQYIVIWF